MLGAILSVAAAEDEPPLPAGPAPVADRVRVALVDSGVNYTLPRIAAALARDADGRALGIDFRDLDNRPFDAVQGPGGRVRRHGTAVASVLLAEAPDVALVPYRYPGQDMRLMHALVEHAAAIGVRAVGLPLGSDDPAQWRAFEAAARAHPGVIFVASAGNDGRNLDRRPLYPAALPLDNLIAVTSADDFGRPSPESGIGRGSVDWLVPAEAVTVTGFDGESRVAAGSSYAVPRFLARLAREFAASPDADAATVVARVRAVHANGLQPRVVGQGLMIDPQADTVDALETSALDGHRYWTQGIDAASRRVQSALTSASAAIRSSTTNGTTSPIDATNGSNPAILGVPFDIFVTGARWTDERVRRTVIEAAAILAQCAIELVPNRVERVRLDQPRHRRLADLAPDSSHTLFERLGRNGQRRRVTAVFAADTRMTDRFDAEAFGAGNTRSRPWLAGSVWLTDALAALRSDAGIALAHELWHVFANSGAHVVPERGSGFNLMLTRTTGRNRVLDVEQCRVAREGVQRQRFSLQG